MTSQNQKPSDRVSRLMTDSDHIPAEPEDLTQAELAHSIIESLLDHTRVISDLIALMAQALDEDTQRAMTQTPQWQAYLESRRRMERTRVEVDKFADTMKATGQD